MKKRHQGVSLIELMVALVIMAILLTAAAPGFATWVRNSKIRASAEAVRDGLQLARGEAVRRNASVRFQLTSSLDGDCTLNAEGAYGPANWVVSADSPAGACGADPVGEDAALAEAAAPRILQKRPADEGSRAILARSSQETVTFTGLGRAPTATSATTAITLRPEDDQGCERSRCLCVTVSVGGQVRLCDPKLTKSADPQACFDRQGAGAVVTCSL